VHLCQQCGGFIGVSACGACTQVMCTHCFAAHVCPHQLSRDDIGDSDASSSAAADTPCPPPETGGRSVGRYHSTLRGEYKALNDAWGVGEPCPWGDKMWLLVTSLPELQDVVVQNGRTRRAFAEHAADDFQRLCDGLAWDVPGGVYLINIGLNRVLVFKPNALVPDVTDAKTALSFLHKYTNTLAVLMRSRDGTLEVGLLNVLYYPHEQNYSSKHRDLVINMVRSWGI